MAPARPAKRQKTNPAAESSSSQAEALAAAAAVPLPETPSAAPEPKAPASPQVEQRSSWYSRTWPRKAPSVAQIARESVSSATSVAQETATVVRDKIKISQSPSLAMTLGRAKSSRPLPVGAMTTVVNATSESSTPSLASRSQSIVTASGKDDALANTAANQNGQTTAGSDPKQNAEEQKPEQKPELEQKQQGDGSVGERAGGDGVHAQSQTAAAKSAVANKADAAQGTWLAWMSKKEPPKESQNQPADNPALKESQTEQEPPKTPPGSMEPSSAPTIAAKASLEPQKLPEAQSSPSSKRTWLQMWNTDNPNVRPPATPPSKAPDDTKPGVAIANKPAPQALDIPQPSTPNSKNVSNASSLETSPPPPLPGDSSKSAGWVFWSRAGKEPLPPKVDDQPHIGEIAISGTPSQSKPRRASITLQEEDRPNKKPKPEESKRAADQKEDDKVVPKQTAAEPVQTPKGKKQAAAPKQPHSTRKLESSNATALAVEPGQSLTPRTASPAPSKKDGTTLLLPAFRDSLSVEENPSLLEQLTRLLHLSKEPELKRLSIIKDPPRIQNALAIGVHGYFPAPLIRSVLGQPTGTSIKFADMAAKAIKKWTRSRGYDCEVKTAALEGEGKIAERVELLWKLLLNWIDEIRKADFVLIACHSQGVPVATMLVAKLIHFGCINAARVGICAMAGVNMGPFLEYKSRFISGSAGELFEFSDPNSRVSLDLHAALETVLKFGVRVTFVGSIDDQLVSMESSIFAPITHPHIYRAVSIDSRIHAPDFLSHLVGFVLKLRNVGVPDHGLIRELSLPLAGSLYTGEGHSRIYEDDAVYDLAISFALETTSLDDVPVTRRSTGPNVGNPYILPFAMRGILEEDYVRKELQNEAQDLLARFDDWKPVTKALKDVKFRLEGIRSKL